MMSRMQSLINIDKLIILFCFRFKHLLMEVNCMVNGQTGFKKKLFREVSLVVLFCPVYLLEKGRRDKKNVLKAYIYL